MLFLFKDRTYRSSQCRPRNQCPEGCERYHHETLHQAYVEGVSFHARDQVQKSSNEDCGACLLQLTEIKSGTPHSIPLIVFLGGGGWWCHNKFNNFSKGCYA